MLRSQIYGWRQSKMSQVVANLISYNMKPDNDTIYCIPR